MNKREIERLMKELEGQIFESAREFISSEMLQFTKKEETSVYAARVKALEATTRRLLSRTLDLERRTAAFMNIPRGKSPPEGMASYGPPSPTISVAEAAKLLGVSTVTIRTWGRQGKLEEIRHPKNNYRLYYRFEIEELMGKIGRSE